MNIYMSVDHVTQEYRLAQYLASLEQGARLAPQGELAETFGVSRMTVRAAENYACQDMGVLIHRPVGRSEGGIVTHPAVIPRQWGYSGENILSQEVLTEMIIAMARRHDIPRPTLSCLQSRGLGFKGQGGESALIIPALGVNVGDGGRLQLWGHIETDLVINSPQGIIEGAAPVLATGISRQIGNIVACSIQMMSGSQGYRVASPIDSFEGWY